MAATMRINSEHDGIELLFPDSERPNASVRTALKEQGFRWHHTGKYWFARQTPERLSFAEKLTGTTEKEASTQNAPEKKAREEKKTREPRKPHSAQKVENTFAASYDSIGSIQIQDSSDIEFHNIPASGVYCKDTNALFRHTWSYGDFISVTDLINAGKTGKTCPTWRLYSDEYNDIVSNHLTGEENLHSCAELIQALRDGKPLESIRVERREDKGIEVFSPFVEVKPLTKMPAEWNKRNLTSALLSGQIYMGQVDYHYTDDYALDAAQNFGEGVGINIPAFAREIVEDWASSTYVRTGTMDLEKNTCTISFSEHSNSGKTLHFDLNCDIQEGKRRADERAAGIRAYNDMMKSSCIQVSPESIDKDKIYSVTLLDMSANTGIYGTKTELVQGSALAEQLSEDCRYLQILSANEQKIVPDQLYEVASFYHPRTYAKPDDRIIDFGNSQQLVTGKALLELTAEGVSLPYIQEAYGENSIIEAARENLNLFIRGEKSFMFTGLKNGGYEASLEKLNREAARVGHPERKHSGINDLIAAAQKKVSQQTHSSPEKSMDVSR